MQSASEIDSYPKMTQLAQSFPTIRKCQGANPFNPDMLAQEATRLSHGGYLAVSFLLSLWDGRIGILGPRGKDGSIRPKNIAQYWRWSVDTPWKIEPFDIVSALSTWDLEHRRAFLHWAASPWWP